MTKVVATKKHNTHKNKTKCFKTTIHIAQKRFLHCYMYAVLCQTNLQIMFRIIRRINIQHRSSTDSRSVLTHYSLQM